MNILLKMLYFGMLLEINNVQYTVDCDILN